MKRFDLTYKSYGSQSILIEWPSKIDKNILKDILRFKNVIEKSDIKEKVHINSAYNSILVIYVFTINNIYNEISILKSLYASKNTANEPTFKRWKIPVCYDDKYGIDLDVISLEKKYSKQEIISLHTAPIYTIYFIGFLPGFLYLGGLDEKLHIPRKSTPRLQVKKGAVAIGGKQTGIYPMDSPGGWNIIGNSPINFFDLTKEVPCFAKAGDSLQFYSVSLKEYDTIKALVDAGVYQLESEVVND